ncbi:MAG: response regulator transcription factor [Sneathiella sp.]
MRTDNLKKSISENSFLLSLPRILIVDSDRSFISELSDYMVENGFVVDMATSIQQAFEIGADRFYDIVIVNTHVVGVSGIHLINSINEEMGVIKIAIIDDHSQVTAKIAALEAGANDCLSKPVNCRELILRIRHQKKLNVAADTSDAPPFVAVTTKQEIYSPTQKKLNLSGNEFQLMVLFMNNSNEVITRDFISAEIYSTQWTYEDRRIDNLVANLRKVIEPVGEPPIYIKTVRNKGYVFVGGAEISAT